MKPVTMNQTLIAVMFAFLFFACGGRTIGGSDNNTTNTNNNDNTNDNQNNNNFDYLRTDLFYTQSYPENGEITIFGPAASLIKLELQNPIEDTWIEKLSFVSLMIPGWDIANTTLYLNGEAIAVGEWNVPELRLTFDLSGDSLFLVKEEGLILEVWAEVTGSICGNMKFYFNPEESRAVGAIYALDLPIVPSAQNEAPTNRLVVGNALSLGATTDTPPYEGTIPQNTEDAPLLELLFVAGEDMIISSHSYNLYFNSSQATLRDFKVWSVNDASEWVVFGGPMDTSSWNCTNENCGIDVSDTIEIPKCQSMSVLATIDVQYMPVNTHLRLAFDTSSMVVFSSMTQEELAPEHILHDMSEVTGFTQTIVSP
jgi:hypothetical protein